MTCDIIIRSYWKDFGWLELCVASIERFCRGFRAVVLVVPRSSVPWLRRLSALPANVRIELCRDYRDDYLGQQATKLAADEFTDADYICHVDSDFIFCRQIALSDLVIDGKPRVVMRPNVLLGRHWPWQPPTEKFLGCAITHDFMQQPPFVYPRWLYGELRAHATHMHGVSLEHYVTTQPPRGFSEFNALGAFARLRHADRFLWIDDSVADAGRPACRWYWSWGGLDARVRNEIKVLLAPQEERGDRPA